MRYVPYRTPYCLCFFLALLVSRVGYTQDSSQRVLNENIKVEWTNDHQFLWYFAESLEPANSDKGARIPFVLDIPSHEKRKLYDPQLLTTALALQLELDPSDIDLSRLSTQRVLDGLVGFEFQYAGQSYRCSLSASSSQADYTVERLEGAPKVGSSILSRARASSAGGDESGLQITNQLDRPVECWWLATDGKAVRYATIAAKEAFHQHTYARHVWSFRDQSGVELARVSAAETVSEVTIDEPLIAAFRELPRTAFRGNRRKARGESSGPATIEKNNIWIRGENAEPFQLTTDGEENDFYRGPLMISPTGRYLAAIKERIVEKRKITIVESSPPSGQPTLRTIEYPKPGDELDQPRVRLFDLDTRQAIDVSDELMPNPWSLSMLEWTNEPEEVLCLYNERGHQTIRVLAINPATNSVRSVVEETSPTFIDYSQKTFVELTRDKSELLWASERTGFNHLFRFDVRSGELLNQVTVGDWPVREVEQVDQEAGVIWFAASGLVEGEDPYYRHLCRVDIDGQNFVRLTDGDGEHRWEFSPDRQHIIDRYSRVDLPPITNLRSAVDGKFVAALEEANWQPLLESGWSAPERFVAKGRDGTTDIYGLIVRPSNFDPAAKYPIVEKIYAGPHSSHVPKAFSRLRQEHEIADLGFIVVMIDGMGTSNRGKVFHDVCWKNLADAGFPDRKAWIQAAALVHPEMDLTRVGIFGGSAGGQNAMRALLDHHDFYHVAVADCGCHDNRMDKIWWNEAWMGWPVDESYARSSNVTDAHRLQGQLLLIVGELDSNVDPASTMQVVDALVKADKDFELLVIPGAGHGAAETRYGSRRRAEFLQRHLLGK